jgi:predicted membrane GTPase involved in stress response
MRREGFELPSQARRFVPTIDGKRCGTIEEVTPTWMMNSGAVIEK